MRESYHGVTENTESGFENCKFVFVFLRAFFVVGRWRGWVPSRAVEGDGSTSTLRESYHGVTEDTESGFENCKFVFVFLRAFFVVGRWQLGVLSRAVEGDGSTNTPGEWI